MNDQLPEGWALVPLATLCTFNYGTSAKSALAGEVPVLRMGNIQNGELDWSDLVFTSDPAEIARFKLEPNTVLFNRTNSPELVGKTAIYRGERPAIFAGYLIRVNPAVGLDPNYLNFFLNSRTAKELCLQAKTDGVSQSNINATKLGAFEIPLSPFREQQRIVTEVNAVLATVQSCKKRLDKLPLIIKRFRQTVLVAACTGRLTEDWRVAHPTTESGASLLARVQATLPKQATGLPTNETDEEGDTPSTWVRCSLSQLFVIQTGATPLKSNPEYFKDGKIPWVKTGEVQNGDIWQAEQFITKRAIEETNAKVFPAGTLLIAMYGEGKTRGQVGRLRIAAATNQASAALVNPKLPPEITDYVFYYALSQYNRLRAEALGGNQPNLSLGIIKSWRLSLPPLEEQREIVRRVNEFFALAEKLERRYTRARTQVEKMTQSILAKAFRGELVPTEAVLAKAEGRSYETAEALLARVAARTSPNGSGRASRPRSKR